MKTIVNIPDYLYEHLNEIIRGSMHSMLILDYVKQGTPLPKGHGRIVDENEITSFGWNYEANHASVNAPTIIEADKGEEDMTTGEQMNFPNTFDEFAKDYGFKDKKEIYTNGSELIQVYRVKQWLEHISTTKNNLEVDCIDRVELLKAMDTWDKFGNDTDEGLIPLRTPALQDRYVPYVHYYDMVNCVKGMPSVTPQLSSELEKNSKKLEKDFGELDCISRQAVLDLIADYDLSMGQVVRGIHALPSVNLQEPKIGHWIPTYGNVKCSECGSVKDSREVGKATHYCDFCGAKMESEG